ncbi:uncharacterized protein PG986_006547 [Apiospora aurea]|uniref:Ankyrin repeat protein n=1 Tax=Apiospora aurea TaxID=335848 RepID=A0ABR1QKZ0_9PEZI
MATGIEIIGAVAAGIEIAKFSKSLVGLITDITKESSEIEHSLLHTKATIEGVARVFENVQKVIQVQEVTESDSLVAIVSDSGQYCAGLLKRIQDQLPELPEDAGLKKRVRAALTKKLNGKAIKEQVGFLRHYMQIAQLAVSAIESRQILRIDAKIDRMRNVLLELPAAPPYSPGSLEHIDYDRLRGTIDKLREAATTETSIYDPDIQSIFARGGEAVRVSSSDIDGLPSEIQKLLMEEPPPAPPQHDMVNDFEARGMLLKAANVDCPRPVPYEQEMEHEERRADILLRCATVRRQRRALGILNHLWDWESQQEDTSISPERLARLGSKLARLSLDSQRLGHSTEQQRADDRERASEVLNRSMEVLMASIQTLRPFPCDSMLSVGELFIHLLKENGKANYASSVKRVLPQKLGKELKGEMGPLPPDWPRRFEASRSNALEWCEPASLAKLDGTRLGKKTVGEHPDAVNLKFDVRSPDFHFDGVVEGISPLHLAVIYEEKDVVAEMLSEVEDVDVRSLDQSTPLMEAARSGNADIAQMLLDHGASVECVDAKMQRTVLHWCQTSDAQKGVSVAKLFLHGHVNSLLEQRDIDGKTALYLACETENRKMVELLVHRYQANVCVADQYGKTALHLTVDSNPKDRLEDRRRIARILLQGGADPDTSDSRDHTPSAPPRPGGRANPAHRGDETQPRRGRAGAHAERRAPPPDGRQRPQRAGLRAAQPDDLGHQPPAPPQLDLVPAQEQPRLGAERAGAADQPQRHHRRHYICTCGASDASADEQHGRCWGSHAAVDLSKLWASVA